MNKPIIPLTPRQSWLLEQPLSELGVTDKRLSNVATVGDLLGLHYDRLCELLEHDREAILSVIRALRPDGFLALPKNAKFLQT